MVANTEFRAMKLKDLSTVMANEKAGYSQPWSEGIFRDCLKQHAECWLLILQEKIVGHGILSTGAGEGHLLNVCVSEPQQGKGLGRKLTLHLLSRAKRRGLNSIFLEVRPSNRVARALYDSLGFNEIGRRKGYYPGGTAREDALVMAKELI
ncbi:MAG TPA: ribosomal-protein-alanine N-acetyltransferase [Gammaproteobacteria bacterium]|nr:ribosomal-protein-alanine N-acetyltransferase [Gammaproteobacteria bacterium]HIK71208.1 ribosomal-protein-alanine N-acetyltransferase [Pseudomonadales bacterium]